MTDDEAIKFARKTLEPWLSAGGADEFAKRMRRIELGSANRLKCLFDPSTESTLENLRLSSDAGDREAKALLYEWSYIAVMGANIVPTVLKNFIASSLFEQAELHRRKRGPNPDDDFARNFAITYAVARVSENGFDATRTQQERECSCSIVSKALEAIGAPFNMSEDNVERIWGAREKLSGILRNFVDGSERMPDLDSQQGSSDK